MRTSTHKNRGVSLVEVVVGSAIILLAIGAITATFTLFLRSEFDNVNQVQAALLAEEGIEAIRSIRDAGYTTGILPLSTSTPYYLVWNSASSTWATSTSMSLVDGQFLRKVTFANVYRNATDDIAATGTYDSGTRLVTVRVSWAAPGGTTTRTLSTYIANLFSN